MKLRIKGNSLRLRVMRPELARLLAGAKVEETIHFGPDSQESLRYTLASRVQADALSVQFRDRAISVAISVEQLHSWKHEDQVGIYATLNSGAAGVLEVAIEKDFACLDGKDEENAGTFSHPLADKPVDPFAGGQRQPCGLTKKDPETQTNL